MEETIQIGQEPVASFDSGAVGTFKRLTEGPWLLIRIVFGAMVTTEWQ